MSEKQENEKSELKKIIRKIKVKVHRNIVKINRKTISTVFFGMIVFLVMMIFFQISANGLTELYVGAVKIIFWIAGVVGIVAFSVWVIDADSRKGSETSYKAAKKLLKRELFIIISLVIVVCFFGLMIIGSKIVGDTSFQDNEFFIIFVSMYLIFMIELIGWCLLGVEPIYPIQWIIRSERNNRFKKWLNDSEKIPRGFRFYNRFAISLIAGIILLVFKFFEIFKNEVLITDIFGILISLTSYIFFIYVGVLLVSSKTPFKKTNGLKRLSLLEVNITKEMIEKYPIYVLNKNSFFTDWRFFRLKLDDLFNDEAEEKELYIQEAQHPINYKGEEVKEIDNSVEEILLLVNVRTFKNGYFAKRMRINLSYKVKDSDCYMYKYYDVIFTFSTEGYTFSLEEKFQLEFKEHPISKKKKSKLYLFSKRKDDEFSLKEAIINATRKIPIFNNLESNVNLLTSVDGSRKVLIHDKPFGVGKSTYDVHSIKNNGRIPIVISPWESNYDHDILYLIFDSIRKKTGKNSFGNFFYRRDLFLWLVTIVLFCAELGFNLIEKYIDSLLSGINGYIGEKVFDVTSWSYEVVYWSLTMLIFYCTTKIIFGLIIPDLILFKKDHTRVYKDFYVDSIVGMLKGNSNYILLIEDVDRLSAESQSEVFRILGSINSKLQNRDSFFAIISLDREKMIGNENREYPLFEYEEIMNKLVYSKWGEKYDAKSSMQEYVDLNIEVIELLYKKAILNTAAIKKGILKESVNFRDLYNLFHKMEATIWKESDLDGENEDFWIELWGQVNEELKNSLKDRNNKVTYLNYTVEKSIL